MRPGNNIVQFGKEVSAAIDRFTKSLPPDVKIETISNQPQSVHSAIVQFLKEFGIAIFAVILVTIILLPRRVALIAASTIPISIFITIGCMWVSGIELQTVSLAGLIIVLGMVVDNAIVIIDNYVEKLDSGITPFEAASKSVTELFGSVFSATLIIIICYVPMPFLMKGTGKDFIASLPATVAFALFISLIVSALLVPFMSYLFIKHGIKGEANKGKKAAFLNGLQKFYDRVLEASFKRKRAVILFGAATFIIGLYLLSISPQESFPAIERNQFAVEVYLPAGSSLQQTDAVLKDLEKRLQADSRVQVVTSFVGASSPRFHTIYAPNFPAKHYGQLVVLTKSNEATVEILNEYSKKYKVSPVNPSANIKWKQLQMTPSKAPIEIRITGDTLPDIKETATRVENVMHKFKGVQWVRNDFGEPLQTIDLNIKPDEADRLGYSKSILSYSLLVGTKGFPVSKIWEDDYPVDVVLRVDKKVKSSPEEILNQYVTSPFLISSVPVRQIADLTSGWTEGEIAHRNGLRTLTVRADIDRDVYTVSIFEKAKKMIDTLKLPEGVSIQYGGDYEMGIENLTPLNYALIISVLITFLILLIQFRKIKTTLLIMGTMPLSIFGASFGVFITGYPFSVTAFIGLISLMGIVIRNGIILISYAEELQHEQNYSLEEAAIAAAKRRMRPIFLTSAAAAVGVVPMIASGSSLWGPLGSVICFGVLFSMILCLFIFTGSILCNK